VFKFLFPGQVYDGHQALEDVKALVHILGTPVVSQACGFLLPYAPGGLRCDVQRWATPAEAWVPPVVPVARLGDGTLDPAQDATTV